MSFYEEKTYTFKCNGPQCLETISDRSASRADELVKRNHWLRHGRLDLHLCVACQEKAAVEYCAKK